MLSERRKVHFKISKQKFKIKFFTLLHKLTKNHLIGQNVMKAIKTFAFSNWRYAFQIHSMRYLKLNDLFKSSYDTTESWCIVG